MKAHHAGQAPQSCAPRSTGPGRHTRAIIGAGSLLVVALAPIAGPYGATLVYPSEGFLYLWEAFEAAQPGDTVRILPGTYGVSRVPLKDRVAIIGSGPSLTTLEGDRRDLPMIEAENLSGILFEGLTVLAAPRTRPGYGGVLYCVRSEVTIRNCVIACGDPTGGTGDGYGGAIYAGEGCSVTLVDCTIRDNRAYGGGAIRVSGYPTGSWLTISGCIVESNYAYGDSAVYFAGPGELIIHDSRFAGNVGGGAAIHCFRAPLTLDNCAVIGNVGTRGGGAIKTYESEFVATNCIIANNVAIDGATNGFVAGAGIWSENSSVRLANCTIAGNKILERNDEDLLRRGGGIFLEDTTAKITNCIFWDNTQDISYTTPSEFDVSYCDMEDIFPGVGIIHEPPRFVDPENGDFRLSGDSPCIDQGLNHPDIIPETDIEGKARAIFGGKFDRPDLGAYEYDPSVPLQICTKSLDGSIADHEFKAELKATGGFAPYSWSFLSGNLPPGLGLSSDGILSGVPTLPGSYELTLSVANLHGEERERTYQFDVSGYRHWYVDASAASPGDGESPASAFASIQDAVWAASAGDIVHVAPGQYPGPIDVDVPIDILGPGPDQATIDGQQGGSAISFWLLPFGKLFGFRITNGLADKGGGLFLYESGITIENCLVESNSANYLGGGIYANLSPAKITDCVVKDNASGLATYYAVQAGGGIYSYFSPLEIDRCIVENNGVKEASFPRWGGGLTLHGSHPVLTNSLIVKNYLDSPSEWKLGAGIFALFGSPAIINCTIADNFIEPDPSRPRLGGIGAVECGIAIVNCIIWGNGVDLLDARAQFSVVGTPPEWVEGRGNISVDPEFVDPASGDYRPKDTSPCIDAGWNLVIEGYESDLDGQTRILNGLVDMGAYENPRHQFGRLVIAREADALILTWNSLPDETYTIEGSEDLLQWELVANQPSAGLYTSWTLPDALFSPKFYRVSRQ